MRFLCICQVPDYKMKTNEGFIFENKECKRLAPATLLSPSLPRDQINMFTSDGPFYAPEDDAAQMPSRRVGISPAHTVSVEIKWKLPVSEFYASIAGKCRFKWEVARLRIRRMVI